jgi:cytochrome c oxidase subunit 2
MDAVPGVAPNEIWVEAPQPGTFNGQCTEFCGQGHADMLAKIVAEPMDAYQKWLADTRRAQEEAGPGQQLAQMVCTSCHSFDPNRPSTLPQAPNLGHYATEGPFNEPLKALKASGDPNWLKKWVTDAPSIKPGTGMPKWQGVLTDEQIDWVVQYLMTLK